MVQVIQIRVAYSDRPNGGKMGYLNVVGRVRAQGILALSHSVHCSKSFEVFT
jgi:hypothetical protein